MHTSTIVSPDIYNFVLHSWKSPFFLLWLVVLVLPGQRLARFPWVLISLPFKKNIHGNLFTQSTSFFHTNYPNASQNLIMHLAFGIVLITGVFVGLIPFIPQKTQFSVKILISRQFVYLKVRDVSFRKGSVVQGYCVQAQPSVTTTGEPSRRFNNTGSICINRYRYPQTKRWV